MYLVLICRLIITFVIESVILIWLMSGPIVCCSLTQVELTKCLIPNGQRHGYNTVVESMMHLYVRIQHL